MTELHPFPGGLPDEYMLSTSLHKSIYMYDNSQKHISHFQLFDCEFYHFNYNKWLVNTIMKVGIETKKKKKFTADYLLLHAISKTTKNTF